MTINTIEGENQFSNLEDRLANLSGYIETTIHEDGILLLYIDRVANHCKRALALMETHHNEAPKSGNENTDTGGTSFQEFESTASSTTDTTGSEKSIRASASMAALESRGSLSVLEARQLFPGNFSPDGSIGLKSPESSSSPSSSKAQFVRTITHAKEQQVRAILSGIKKRMKRRSSA